MSNATETVVMKTEHHTTHAIDRATLWTLIEKASDMHNTYDLDEDGNLLRYDYDTNTFEPWSLYGWLVDQLPDDES